MSLLFNMLSRLVITSFPRSKRLLISWLQSPPAVILEPKKLKSNTASTVSPSISHEVMGPDAMILVSWMLSFKPTFPLSSFTSIKKLFSSSYITTYEIDHQSKSDAWDRALKASALKPWGTGWGGRQERVQGGGHMYTHGCFMSMYGKNHYNSVK